jgi:2-polyprenyl-3-methyl-5-hydroxy-6-metoxy-1,4-benzoquinol methylase
MSSNRLNIVSVSNKESEDNKTFRPKTNREEVQATFEKLWNRDPDNFDPLNNCMDKERIVRTLALIDTACPVAGKKVVDLGCGRGTLSRALKEKGAHVSGVDIAKNALEIFRKEGSEQITLIQDCLPNTALQEDSFDIVVCTDLIGYLKPREHRLFFSELARLVKKEGYIICSTPIDLLSEDALEKFAALAETELEIVGWKLSYHKYYLRILDFFIAPSKFVRARKDLNYRKKALNKRSYFAKWWFQMNSAFLMGSAWHYLQHLFTPFFKGLRQSKYTMLTLEKICYFISSDSGISHAIFAAKRRSITEIMEPENPPIEMKRKKTVWE